MPDSVLALVMTKPPHTQFKRAFEQADEVFGLWMTADSAEAAARRLKSAARRRWWLLQRQKMTQAARLQDQALLLLLLLGEKSSTSSSFENLAHILVVLSRAFEVFVRANLLANLLTLVMERQPEIPRPSGRS